MYVWDDDANSTNGISMSLPEIYRTMKRIDLVTGEKSQAAYDKDNFIIVFNDERFSFKNGDIIVDAPDDIRYLSCEARIIWKNDKLTFSKYDIAITVPVIWTNMSQSEMKEKFTASVAVGNETDGYTTVWSALRKAGRVRPAGAGGNSGAHRLRQLQSGRWNESEI